MFEKPCVEVIAYITRNGDTIPLRIRLHEDGEEKVYTVDKPEKPVKGASLKIGIQGDRYSCRIEGRKAYLFCNNENKWFIELI